MNWEPDFEALEKLDLTGHVDWLSSCQQVLEGVRFEKLVAFAKKT
jgi:hypothetical protein